MDGKGERVWTHKGTGMISIKNGDKYYLRMTTKDGNITAVTYRYIDKKNYETDSYHSNRFPADTYTVSTE